MNSLRHPLILIALASASLSTALHADTLAGHVQNTSGMPVQGVNIDLEDMITGDRATIMNGGTDAAGNFNLTVGPGLYRVIFIPPSPPVTTDLITIVENVVVSGASLMGTTVLDPGVAVQGRLVTTGGVAIPNIDLDFFDHATGVELDIPGDSAGATGQFLVALPFGQVDMEIRPSQLALPLYAPQHLEYDFTGTTNLGDITVRAGFVLSGTVRRTNGTAVASANSDVIDAVTGDQLFTPGDGTNGTGFVDVVVPAGTYHFDVCPPNGSGLAGQRTADVVVAGTTNMGIITLQNGIVLSGQLTDSSGAPVSGGDIDVRDASTEAKVVTCNDNTNASGIYSVLVPSGTYDVLFSAPGNAGAGGAIVPNVNVAGATTVDGKLPGCECTRYCAPLPNSSGQAACLTGNGSIVAGDQNFQLVAQNMPGNVPGLFFFGPNQIQAPFGDGRRCVGGATVRIQPPAFAMGGSTVRTLNFAAPSIANNIVMGADVNFQLWYRDAMGGPAGFNLSDGLNVVWQ